MQRSWAEDEQSARMGWARRRAVCGWLHCTDLLLCRPAVDLRPALPSPPPKQSVPSSCSTPTCPTALERASTAARWQARRGALPAATCLLPTLSCSEPALSTSLFPPTYPPHTGDVNLFLNDLDEPHTGEVEIMVAAPCSRRKGLGEEALQLFMAYCASALVRGWCVCGGGWGGGGVGGGPVACGLRLLNLRGASACRPQPAPHPPPLLPPPPPLPGRDQVPSKGGRGQRALPAPDGQAGFCRGVAQLHLQGGHPGAAG